MKRKHVIIIGIIVLIAVAVLCYILRTENMTSTTPPQVVDPKAAVPDERGSQPAVTRLRNGARQIENATDALAAAEKSLARVESELASTTDAERRMALERQKALIEAAITKLKR